MTDYYCIPQDVRNALTPGGSPAADNTNPGMSAASLNGWQIIDAIIEAQTIIDSYVTERYKIIIAPSVHEEVFPETEPKTYQDVMVAPQPIRAWTRTIAAWYATLTFRQHKDLEERDPVQLRYDSVITMLAQVRAGILSINLPLLETSVDGGVTVVNNYEGDMFTLDDLGLGVGSSSGTQRFIPRYDQWP